MAKSRTHPYGRNVVGEEEAARQREVKKKKTNVYGPKVTGAVDEPAPVKATKAPKRKAPKKKAPEAKEPKTETAPKTETTPETPDATEAKKEAEGTEGQTEGAQKEEAKVDPNRASLTLEELAELLEKEPARLDAQIDAELRRSEGARKGALRTFIATELKRDGGPRADVLDLLERALAGN